MRTLRLTRRVLETRSKDWCASVRPYIGYSKLRRKTNKKRRRLTRALLKLLLKFDRFLDQVEEGHSLELPELYLTRRETIKEVYAQQHQLFATDEKPKGRIVSLSKNYLRPIVRGKEIKKVEFGARVNKLQIDGINFIEHISFDAFNEGTRFKSTIYKAQGLTNLKTKVIGADAIYATNKNRVFATANAIKTDFRPKGETFKASKAARSIKEPDQQRESHPT